MPKPLSVLQWMEDSVKSGISQPGKLEMLVEAYQEMGKPVHARFPDCYEFSAKRPPKHYCQQCGILLVKDNADVITTITAVDKDREPVKFRITRRRLVCEMCETRYIARSACMDPSHFGASFAILAPLPFAGKNTQAALAELVSSSEFHEPILAVFQDGEALPVGADKPPLPVQLAPCLIGQFLDKKFIASASHELLLELNSKRQLTKIDRGKSVSEYKFKDSGGPAPESLSCPFCSSKSVRRGFSESRFKLTRMAISIEAFDRNKTKVRFLFDVSTFLCDSCGNYFHESFDSLPHSYDCFTKFKIAEPLSFLGPRVPNAQELVPYISPWLHNGNVLNGKRLSRKKAVLDSIDRSVLPALLDKFGRASRRFNGDTVTYDFSYIDGSKPIPACPDCKSNIVERGCLKKGGAFIPKEIHAVLASKDIALFRFGAPIYFCKNCDTYFSEKIGPLNPDAIYDRFFKIDGELEIDPYQELDKEALAGFEPEA